MLVTRERAAIYIAERLDINDFDTLVNGVSDSRVLAVLNRSIFGPLFKEYKFRGNDFLNRYELSRLSICLYAYLLGRNEYNIEPGGKNVILRDIDSFLPTQRWYIHSAIGYGFMDPYGNEFRPNDNVAFNEFTDTIDRILGMHNLKIYTLKDYKKILIEEFRVAPIKNVPIASCIDVFISSDNRAENILVASLQGLVNKREIELFIDMQIYEDKYPNEYLSWIVDYAIRKSYIKSKNIVLDSYDLLIKYYNKYGLKKFIAYDFDREYEMNLATNIAAIEERIMISSKMVDKIKKIIPDADIFYMNELGLESYYDCLYYAYNNCFEYLRKDIIGCHYFSRNYDLLRDYAISDKYPIIFIPGRKSEYYDSKCMSLVEDILRNYPENIPVLGFTYAVDIEKFGRQNVGIDEFTGVKLFGKYAKYTCVFDLVGNLSFNTGFSFIRDECSFKMPISSIGSYDKNKKYVAITMTESGDAPVYIEKHLKARQWDDEGRENVPYSYSYGLCNLDLLPLYTKYFMETATNKNYLYGAISGIGYNYPFESYGEVSLLNDDGAYTTRDSVMIDHYKKANELMKKLGFNSLGIYTHSENSWSEEDKYIFEKLMLPYLKEADFIAAEMHRPYNSNMHERVDIGVNGIRCYHCATFWSDVEVGPSYNIENDTKAIEFMADEIYKNTRKGQFFHCMAYSWRYGARRIKLVMDRLKRLYPDEFEFVTMNELDEYYKKSI